MRAVRGVLPPGHAIRVLMAGALVDAFGSGLFTATATLYFVTVAGFPASQVALALSLAALCGLVSPLPLGRVADRFGVVRTYVPLLILRGLGYASYVFVHSIVGYAVLTCLISAMDRGCSPLLQVIVGSIAGDKERTRSLASIRSVRNIGTTGGFLAAGAILAFHTGLAFDIVFVANGVSFGAIGIMVLRAVRISPLTPVPVAGRRGKASTIRPPLRNPGFVIFTFSNGLMMLYDTVISVLLPIWIVQRTDLPTTLLPPLLVVNTILTIVLQLVASRLVGSLAASLRLVRYAAASMVLGCGLFAAAEHLAMWAAILAAIGAVLMVTVAENIHQVASWELSYAMSPASARARYLGAFSMGQSAQRIVGPALLVSVLFPLHEWAWPALAALFVVVATVALSSAGSAIRYGLADGSADARAVPVPLEVGMP